MAELRMFSVSFDTQLLPWQLPQFRGAIAQKVGLEHEWFHNHDQENGGFHQRYPLIQYKIDGHNKKLRPMLVYLQAGVEEAHRYFSQPDWTLRIGSQHHDMRIARLNVQQHQLRVTDKPHTYRIHHWKPINPENYQHFRSLHGIAEQFAFLESLLRSHVLAFASGVGWQLDARFHIKITEQLKREWVEYKGIKVLAFTLDFEGNVALPDGVGLGKGASIGYGVLRRQARERR
jgi:Cas6b C-terminal domain/Cas6b N-terminal domain